LPFFNVEDTMLGLGKRISYAFRCFFSIVSNGEIPGEIAPEVTKTPEKPENIEPKIHKDQTRKLETGLTTDSSVDRAVQMLALLQRDGRLIDFLSEDISAYQDAQIGAAVRDIHENCRKTLEKYVKLEPVINSEEDKAVTVEDNLDPAAIKLVGNVNGKAPLRGLLRHRGWRVKEISLPPLPDNAGRKVVAPAEIEL
jgi:hypothetical protein